MMILMMTLAVYQTIVIIIRLPNHLLEFPEIKTCFCLEGRMTDVLKIPFLLFGGRFKPAIFFSVFS